MHMTLEMLQSGLQAMFPQVLGLELLVATPDLVQARLTVRPELCTLGGTLHGGAVMTLADTLGAIGTFLTLPEGKTTTTLESKTNFISAAAEGVTVMADCTPLHQGGRTQVWQTRLTRAEDGKLIAITLQTQMILG